jgi:cell shape-determining protein MreC
MKRGVLYRTILMLSLFFLTVLSAFITILSKLISVLSYIIKKPIEYINRLFRKII